MTQGDAGESGRAEPSADLTRSLGESPTSGVPGTAPPRGTKGSLPAHLGQFRIVRMLGEGGMGAVYEAEQQRPRRMVALKVIRASAASGDALRRFEHEAEVLARLQHPGIAQVYDAGTFDAGGRNEPYFAMELIRGVPLTRYAEEKRLGTRERLGLMVKICDAVQHAHTKGIVHRDLKPANILVDESGQPKILDFGIARLTGSDVQVTTLQTDVGQLIGTIPYMSPEQAAGDPHQLDTRSDVYALGVVCYELLAGRLPHQLRNKLIHEAVRIIREEEPTPLSSIDRVFRGDVETIVGTALAKERARRYQTAAEMAADISRYLRHEPVAARPPSTWYQLAKFSRRNRVLVAGVGATVLALIAGLIATSAALRRARAAELDARQRAAQLSEVAEFQASQLREIDPHAMGERLGASLAAEIVSGLERGGAERDEIDSAAERLREALGHANLTNVALSALDQNIFERALKAIDERFASQPLVKAELLQSLADTMAQLGLLDRAAEPQSQALEIRRRELGEDHGFYLISLNNSALLLNAQGKLAEAEPLLREALRRKRRVLGDDHTSTLASLSSLGRLLREKGELAESEACYREAVERRRRVVGEDDPDTLLSVNGLGDVLQAQGRLADAEPYCRAAAEGNRRVLGGHHPATLLSINNLASLLYDQGKRAEAEPLWREVLDARRRVLGDDHPDTLISLNNLGFLYRAQGRYAEALECFGEALDRKRRVLGEDHPSTLASLSNMGLVLFSRGSAAEAEPYWREAMEKRRAVLGERHPQTLMSVNNLGQVLRQLGRNSEAEACFRDALDGRLATLEEDHPDVLDSMYTLGDLLRATGRLDEAAPLLDGALAGARRTLGPDHTDTFLFLGGRGRLLHAQHRLDEAESDCRAALDGSTRSLGPGHPRTLAAAADLGNVLIDSGRWPEARAVLLPAGSAAVEGLQPEHAARLGLRRAIERLYATSEAAEPGRRNADEWDAWRRRFDDTK